MYFTDCFAKITLQRYHKSLSIYFIRNTKISINYMYGSFFRPTKVFLFFCIVEIHNLYYIHRLFINNEFGKKKKYGFKQFVKSSRALGVSSIRL